MCRYFIYLGLISHFLFGALAKENVEVNEDITVKPTPNPLTNDADRVNVTLSCTGSRSELSYYITNHVSWTFISSRGKELPLTDGFFESGNASHLFSGPEKRFEYDFKTVDIGVNFEISIAGVTRDDNGIYRCFLEDKDKQVIDSKDVRLTVVNPVETVTIELYDEQHTLKANSSSPISQTAEPIKITAGQYMVKCVASGSNPEPEMKLFLNELKPHVSVNTHEDNSTKLISYVGVLEVKNLTISSHNAPQGLVCTANIPDDFYASSEAGVVLTVPFHDPSFVCENITAALADRNCQLKCNVTDNGQTNSRTCDSISWLLGTTGQRIGYEQRWNDPNKNYDNMESTCEKANGILTVTLNIFNVNSKVFEETFFIVYGNGENAHRHPVKVYEVTSVRSSTPHDITTAYPVTNVTPADAAVVALPMTFSICLVVVASMLITFLC